MTKSRGIGRGGLRSPPGGRPRKHPLPPKTGSEAAPPPRPAVPAVPPRAAAPLLVPLPAAFASMTEQEIMEYGMRFHAAAGRWIDAAKIAKGLAMIRSRPKVGAIPGKKGERADAAEKAAAGRFAPRPPPRIVVDNT